MANLFSTLIKGISLTKSNNRNSSVKGKRKSSYARWKDEERMLVVSMSRLGAPSSEIAEILSKYSSTRTVSAVDGEKSNFMRNVEPNKTYYLKITF